MNSKPIVAGNWKMHKTLQESVSFVGGIKNRILDKVEAKVIFCPPFTALFSIVNALEGTDFGVGAQNTHFESQGAFTGEISVEMLKSTGLEYVILGHSERRHVFGESDEWINKKVHAVLAGGLVPIFCIGEILDDRKANRTTAVLESQIKFGLGGLESIDQNRMIIAYEPVWAIGTGETASTEQVAEAHASVKSILNELFGPEANEVPILYGGSVNDNNAVELIRTEGVDGFLIGGASLKEDSFCSIIEKISKFYRG
ncbi:MAG: triose-phosphate isomerase [Candidatus Marinimicrobia bacterium]|nr:triose-phosphate isomerase [Candidatus Neomarinimicrobiota bacterium]